MDIINIDNLSKKYKDTDVYAVKNLSLQVFEGEIFGLLGPNGAGKTTLISMLCGLIAPSSGSFTVAGLSYKNAAMKIRKLVAVVPQEYALYPTLTARENLTYFGAMYGLKGDALRRLIADSLDQMGLSKFADKKIGAYSGGMKRRVNLLAGILHEPRLLFLDEPTVGVDVQSKNVILDFLKEKNQSGMTILYTSHHLLEAQELCSRIAIIEGGEVVVQGTPQGLIDASTGARNLEDVFIALTGRGLRDAI